MFLECQEGGELANVLYWIPVPVYSFFCVGLQRVWTGNFDES